MSDDHSDFMQEWIDTVRGNPETRTLRARYSQELADDLRAVHGLNVEEALGDILTEEIARELSVEPLMMPALRRVMPELMAGELVNVQPMAGVVAGQTFALRFNAENRLEATEVKKDLEYHKKQDHFKDEEDIFKI